MEAPGYELRPAPPALVRGDTTSSTGSSTLANSTTPSSTTRTTASTRSSQTSLPSIEESVDIASLASEDEDGFPSSRDPDAHLQAPYKPQGYNGLSRMLNSDHHFLLFRRFGKLSIRNILYLQDRLVELEERLRERDAAEGVGVFHDTRRWDRDLVRRGLMKEVQAALIEYEQAIKTHSTLLQYPTPSTPQRQSLKNYFSGNHPIVSEEERYIQQSRDLLSLTPEDRSPLQVLIESRRSIQRLFMTPADKAQSTKDPVVQYYSIEKVRRAYKGLVLLGGWVFIVAPIVVLWFIEEMWKRLIVIVACLCVFSSVLVMCTKARDWEALAATAAYAAVLVVFVSSDIGKRVEVGR